MNRIAFHKLFKSPGPVVLAVIPVQDEAQVRTNIRIAIEEGAPGLFLLNRDPDHERLVPVLRRVRRVHPALWLGVNFRPQDGRAAFPLLGRLAKEEIPIDALWVDDAGIDEKSGEAQPLAEEIDRLRAENGWQGLYFGGCDFKRRPPVAADDWETAAGLARDRMEVVTTAGPAGGRDADLVKLTALRSGCGRRPLALASGVTLDSVATYAPLVDAFLVQGAIAHTDDFQNIDRQRLRALLAATRERGARGF